MKNRADLGIAFAIQDFIKLGYTVSIPLNDKQYYDLVVDKEDILYRVQVKTTTAKSVHNTGYIVELRTKGGTTGVHLYNMCDKPIDILYVLTELEDRYLIPVANITSKTSVTLNSLFDKFKL